MKTMNTPPQILIVDDEPDNRLILESYLNDAHYTVASAESGAQAWEMMTKVNANYDLVLMDWMMPGESGLEILKKMRQHKQLRYSQVVMQTARARSSEIQQGIDAGAWYYLTKPFDEETLLAIVRTALTDRKNFLDMQHSVRNATSPPLSSNRFSIRTIEEAENLAALLAKLCRDPERRGLGFLEILRNAVEHGNLGIGYEEKTTLLAEGLWATEINRRLNLPENSAKMVEVLIEHSEDNMIFRIKDQGEGFDWKQYLTFDPQRATHTHGRGIAMAKHLSLDQLEYHGKGNEVTLFVGISSRTRQDHLSTSAINAEWK